jgi:trigger factor
MAERARMMPGQEQRVFEFYQKNPAAMQELQAPIFEDKVIDFILAVAKVSDKKVSPAELMQDAEAVAEAGGTAG